MIVSAALFAALVLVFGQPAQAAETDPAKSDAGRPLFAQGSAPASTPKVEQGTARSSTDGSLAAGAVSRGVLGEIVPTAAALVGTITVIVLARSALRRFGGLGYGLGSGRRPSGVVEILARYPVSRGQQVILLKVGRRVIVTHQSAQGMRALSEFTEADDVADLLARCEGAARKTSEFSFDALLRQSGSDFDAKGTTEPAGISAAHPVRRGGLAASVRDLLPAQFQGAEVETVDLTRGAARVQHVARDTARNRGGER